MGSMGLIDSLDWFLEDCEVDVDLHACFNIWKLGELSNGEPFFLS